MDVPILKSIIDEALAGNSKGLPSYEDMVSKYVDEKLGIDEARKAIEEDPDISDDDKDHLLEELEKERIKLNEYYINGEGRQGFENKYNELKAELNSAKTAATKLPSAITSAIALILIPPTLTGVPNPIKEAINLNTSKNQILSAIESFLGSLSKIFGISSELGLDDNSVIKNLAKISEPLISAKAEMEKQETQESDTTSTTEIIETVISDSAPDKDSI